jgi:hypothetical protein
MADRARLTAIPNDPETRVQCPFCKGKLFESWDDDAKESAAQIEVRAAEKGFQVREPGAGTAQPPTWRDALPPHTLMCLGAKCVDADGVPHFFDLSKEGVFDPTLG